MKALIITAAIIAYIVGWYHSSLWLSRHMNDSEDANRYGGPDKKANLALSMFLCLGWPITLSLMLLHKKMLGKVGPTARQLAAENEELRRTIYQKEIELGILKTGEERND